MDFSEKSVLITGATGLIGSTLAVSAWNLLLYTVLWLIPELLITSMTAKR